MHARLHFHDYSYFPYEKRLALREAETLLGEGGALPATDYISMDVGRGDEDALKRLTYFSRVTLEDGTVVIPDQARWEAAERGQTVRRDGVSIKRQSTRYSLHGLHEYKGKFNPQIVRTLGNLFQIEPGDHVLDPFSGSGTVLLEGAHMGWNAVGLDLNPLAVLIANAKVGLLRLGHEAFCQTTAPLVAELGEITASLEVGEQPFGGGDRERLEAACTVDHLPGAAYLADWFPEDVLLQFRVILSYVQRLDAPAARDGLRVCLSNIARQVSWQMPSDLRVRRRKDPADNYPALPLFLEEVAALKESLENTEAPRALLSFQARQQALCRDNRTNCARPVSTSASNRRFDAAITSPPYASALPYIDTGRLSLVLLELTAPERIRDTERTLIGNREIRKSTRRVIDDRLASNADDLPGEVVSFLRDMLTTVKASDVGFRRRNKPALLYKYFADMKKALHAVHGSLKPGAPFALVVGVNKTKPDGKEEVVIPTPRYVAEIADTTSFSVESTEELDAYHRYDMHQANSIKEEALIILRA
jgi:site-specific DNA-methyltransferase (cytosine-N4-specific)